MPRTLGTWDWESINNDWEEAEERLQDTLSQELTRLSFTQLTNTTRGIHEIPPIQEHNQSSASPTMEPRNPMNEATKIYQCPVCLSLPVCIIYQCTEGHLICMDCHNKMERPVPPGFTLRPVLCPTCKSHMPATPIRSRVAEQVMYSNVKIQTWRGIFDGDHEGSVREKNGIGDGFFVCCNFSIVTRWIDQLFNQNPTNFPSFPLRYQHDLLSPSHKEGRKENCSKRWDFD